MTFFPDARGNAEAASAVDAFRARGYEPEGYTLHAYAAVQVWAQAVEKAKVRWRRIGIQDVAEACVR